MAVTWAYLRRADREFESLERRGAEAARRRMGDAGAGERTRDWSVR